MGKSAPVQKTALKSMALSTRRARKLLNTKPLQREETVGRKSPSTVIDLTTHTQESATAHPLNPSQLDDIIQASGSVMDSMSMIMNILMLIEDARIMHDVSAQVTAENPTTEETKMTEETTF
jgi:hypothetical protein